MTDDRPLSADRVPTLTEVIEFSVPDEGAQFAGAAPEDTGLVVDPAASPPNPGVDTGVMIEAAASTSTPAPVPVPGPVGVAAADVDAVVEQILAELLPRIDMLLESRLREALAPALARAADGLIRDTRMNLSVAVRDLVQETVDRALQRRNDA